MCSGMSLFISSGEAPANCYEHSNRERDYRLGNCLKLNILVMVWSYITFFFCCDWRTSCLKLNKAGRGRPLGRRAFGSRSSLKNGCAHASSFYTETTKKCQLKENISNIGQSSAGPMNPERTLTIKSTWWFRDTDRSVTQARWVLKKPRCEVNGFWRHPLMENLKVREKYVNLFSFSFIRI